MNKRIPPLPALRTFEAVAWHMSFARAANELHVTAAFMQPNTENVFFLQRFL